MSLQNQVKKEIMKRKSLNVRSTLQMSTFLYDVLKLPKRTKKGKLKTDETTINMLFILTKHEFLNKIILLRKVLNNYSKYGKLQLDREDMVRTTYRFCDTGRLSSGRYSAK